MHFEHQYLQEKEATSILHDLKAMNIRILLHAVS